MRGDAPVRGRQHARRRRRIVRTAINQDVRLVFRAKSRCIERSGADRKMTLFVTRKDTDGNPHGRILSPAYSVVQLKNRRKTVLTIFIFGRRVGRRIGVFECFVIALR